MGLLLVVAHTYDAVTEDWQDGARELKEKRMIKTHGWGLLQGQCPSACGGEDSEDGFRGVEVGWQESVPPSAGTARSVHGKTGLRHGKRRT